MTHVSSKVASDASKPIAPSGLPFPVVGIGASAGGIEAVKQFFELMPQNSEMAFVVILHLSPRHESNVDKIVQRITRMPVLQVSETVAIEKNHIYVISPAMQLEMSDGHLHVSSAIRPREKHIAIDLFFRTLADAHREQAFAIVLSGTGSDGTAGMARIKEQGGLTLAQLPEDAQFDDMPRSAMEAGVVDFVLPVSEMSEKLLDLWRNASQIELPAAETLPAPAHAIVSPKKAQAAEAALAELLRLLCHRTGHDFKHYKKATILRRIERRMQVCSVKDVPQYLAFFEKNSDEAPALLRDLLIGVTNFFRDREAFEALERDIVPSIFEGHQDDDSDGIRAWTVACSTGEETYSLAMILSAEADLQGKTGQLQVFGSDVDEKAIAIARKGVYPASIVADIPPAHLRRFFSMEDAHYRITKDIRDRILFAPHNVLNDPPFSRLHLISCRNFLIYLDRHAQRQVLQIFHTALRPGGYLFLGSSETAEVAEDLFTTVDKRNRIYCATKTTAKIVRALPALRRADRPPVHQPKPPVDIPHGKADPYIQLHQEAMEQYGPPTLLLNAAWQIVRTSGSAGQFLRHSDGRPTHNLLSLIDPKIRPELRALLLQAKKTDSKAESRMLLINRDGAECHVKIAVNPLKSGSQGKQLTLLTFNEFEPAPGQGVGLVTSAGVDPAIQALELEVQSLTEQLHDTLGKSEASTEDMKAANEELQAINEELRSATEELETSKEELQSMNEELITVNDELKAKVDETAKINDDLQNLIASSDIATIFVDGSMRVKWFTPKTTVLFNLLSTDSGRPLTDITHRLDYPGMALDAADAFGSLRLVEREVRSHDGRWYLARILPYRTAEDHISGATLNFVDITSRRQAEQRLREGLERLRLVAESTTQFAIITTDQTGRITGWNRAAEVMFGYEAAEAMGQAIDLIFTPEDRANDIPALELKKARESGHADDERWHQRKDGTRFFCSGSMHPLDDGELHGYAKIARDMTEKHLEEEEQEADLKRSHASNLLKDEFIAVMSHELRHPLNLIQLNVDVLARNIQAGTLPGAAKAVEAIRRSVRSQSQIIEDLLDLSRAKTGKLSLERAPVPLQSLLANIVEVIAAQAQAADLRLQAEGLEQNTPEALVVYGDHVRIEQIAWNLLSNAIRFTPPGGTVKVSLTREDNDARIDVTDSGIGIPNELLPNVFEMFTQIADQRSGQGPTGLGIGLALVSQLAQAHGGRVAAISEGKDKGCTFSVWLPLVGLEEPSSDDQKSISRAMLPGIRILLVDDSEEIVETLGGLLRAEGAQVVTATNGFTALEVLASEDFDVLVSDIGMPGMDGYALLKALRKSKRNAKLPAIALSGYARTDSALAVGFTDQLKKPVALTDLVNILNRLVPPG